MKRGEVWWVDFEPAIGGEIRKTRPAIIVSNDSANTFLNRIQVVPCSSNTSRLYPCETIIEILNEPAKAMTDQIVTVSKLRCKTKIGTLSPTEMSAVSDIIRLQLEL